MMSGSLAAVARNSSMKRSKRSGEWVSIVGLLEGRC
jgi:hypothetical protein